MVQDLPITVYVGGCAIGYYGIDDSCIKPDFLDNMNFKLDRLLHVE